MKNRYKIISRDIVRGLRQPKPESHKGDNGRLLIAAGSRKYHGSLLFSLKTAARIVDLVYVLTDKENEDLVKRLRGETAAFITVRNTNLYEYTDDGKVDCVLIGPGMGETKRTYRLVEKVLKSKIKAVLDADALRVLDLRLKRLLNARHILTPHGGEFKKTFGLAVSAQNVLKIVKKYKCNLVLKGKVDIVGAPNLGVFLNRTGNAGMTKGGTGDVLAGLIAGLFCKNDAFASAAAGVYLNGLAGDELYRKVGPYYDAKDLADQLPKTMGKIIFNQFPMTEIFKGFESLMKIKNLKLRARRH